MIDVRWRKARRLRRESIPSEFCPTCWDKYNRQLWAGSCICTGAVSLMFKVPR
jgi:hypothetical protein